MSSLHETTACQVPEKPLSAQHTVFFPSFGSHGDHMLIEVVLHEEGSHVWESRKLYINRIDNTKHS